MSKRPVRSHTAYKSCKIQSNNQVVLERVLGFTTSSNCSLSLDEKLGLFAHTAGCVVVIRSFQTGKQQFIQSSSKKAITAVDFSADGKYLATGESGHQPMVRVWSVLDGTQLAEFGGHHFRVVAVQFNPTAQYLLSLGSQEDHALYVWDRITGQRVASAKVTNKIHGVAFSPSGHFFVTVGVRYVRFWYLENKRNKIRETLPLQGRNAILGEMFNNVFTDVACCCSSTANQRSKCSTDIEDNHRAPTLTLVVNASGQLLQFNEQRDLDKWVDLKTTKANCIACSGRWLTVGCTNGICLLFESESLQFVAKLPPPHELGSDLTLSPSVKSNHASDDSSYPDVIAIKFDWSHKCVIAFYNDHSIHIWDVSNLCTIRPVESYYYHSRGIWSIDCPPDKQQLQKHSEKSDLNFQFEPTTKLASNQNNNTFITCSDDGTIRFWDLMANKCTNNDRSATSVSIEGNLSTCAYNPTNSCREKLTRVIYTDANYKYLCVSDRPSTGVGHLGGPLYVPGVNTSVTESALPSPVSPTRPSLNSTIDTSQFFNSSNTNQTSGFRTICVSPDGFHLAAGDRDGTLRIYSLEDFQQIHQVQAHDNEILSLNFFRSEIVPQLTLLCSASRDRVIHIFDPSKDYSRVQTIADHSGAIFSAKIIETDDGEIRLISCGMDKSLLFRVLEPDDTGQTAHFALEHHLVGRYSQLDAALTPAIPVTNATNNEARSTNMNNRRWYLAVACQDRRLRIYNVVTARPVRCYRGSYTEDGFLVRCAIDPTGSVIATSGSDKQLNLFHLLSGESIATLYGHSELSLGLRFLSNLNYLISVSADSCIFIWRLAPTLTQHLHVRSAPQLRSFKQIKRTSSEKGVRLSLCQSSNLSSLNGQFEDEDIDNVSTCSRALCTDGLTDSMLNLADESEMEHFACHDLLVPDKTNKANQQTTVATTVSESNLQPVKETTTQSKKPTFYFSVSALPAWAQRKLSRRESVAMVPPSSINQIANADTESVNSDSLSQASLGSGPICPSSSSEHNSIITPNQNENISTAKCENQATKYNAEENLQTPRVHRQITPVITDRRLSQDTTVVSDLRHLNKMSKSECHNYPSSSHTDKQFTSDWIQRTLSAPDTPQNRKFDLRLSGCRRSTRRPVQQQLRLSMDQPCTTSKNRPKDLLIAGFNSITPEVNRRTNKSMCANQRSDQTHILDECENRHPHRSLSSNQIITPNIPPSDEYSTCNEIIEPPRNQPFLINKNFSSKQMDESSKNTAEPSQTNHEDNYNSDTMKVTNRRHKKFAVADIPPLHSVDQATTLDANSMKSVEESLHAVRAALDLAFNRLTKLATPLRQPEPYLTCLREVMTGELEWRFSRLRAILGLPPICVEAPTARVLLADFVERLLPELRSLNISTDNQVDTTNNVRIGGSIDCQNTSQTTEGVEWVVDSTTENVAARTDTEIDSQLSTPSDTTKNEDSNYCVDSDTMTHSDLSIILRNVNADENSDTRSKCNLQTLNSIHVSIKRSLETT